MKKHVLSQIGKQSARSAQQPGKFAWPIFWKLAFLILFVTISLTTVYRMTDQTTPGNGQKALPGKAVATLVRTDRLVEMLRANTEGYVKALPAAELFCGDAIRTGNDSSAELVFADSSKVLLGSNAWFKVKDDGRIGEHLRGRAVFEIEKQTPPDSVEVVVPQGVTLVLGTKFVQDIGETGSFIAVSEGIVEFRANNQPRQLLRPGNLLCFDSSGKMTERKEPGSAAILKLYDLKSNMSLEAALSFDNSDSKDIPKIEPVVEPPATVGDDDVSVPHGNASETEEDSTPEEPDQSGGSGQSSLGASGY
ncbi:hypothetical protein MASR1M12_14350 [Erysipelotrichia bacterium]